MPVPRLMQMNTDILLLENCYIAFLGLNMYIYTPAYESVYYAEQEKELEWYFLWSKVVFGAKYLFINRGVALWAAYLLG